MKVECTLVQQDWDGIKNTKEIPSKDAARFLLEYWLSR